VDQVSPPLRIALVVVLVFAGLWLVVLRPQPVEDIDTEPVPAPSASAAQAPAERGSAARTPAAARKETARAAATAGAREGGTAASASTRTASTRTPKAASAGRVGRGARAVLADLEAGRTVVLLIWDGKSADDRSVRRSVARLDRRGGKVRVHVTTLKRLSEYEAITKGVPITESPTVLVIDRKRRARVISGLTVTAEIDDTIDRALRAS
jgi:hypothetical protein